MAKNNEPLLNIQDDILELIIFKKLATDLAFAHSFLNIGKKEIFSNSHFEEIYKWQNGYYKKYPDTTKCLDVKTMKSFLKPHEKELRSILDSIENTDVSPYEPNLLIHNIDRFVQNRKLDCGALYIMTKSNAGEEYDIARFKKEMDDAFHSSLIIDLGLDYFNQIDQRYEQKKLDILNVVDPGIKALQDNLIDTDGGLAPKTLTVINGQSNIGKSIVLGNIALNAWKSKKNVLIVTCEMSENAYATRLDAAISKIDSREIKDKKDAVIKRIKNEHKIRKDKSIYIKEFPTGQLTPAKLRAYLTQLRSTFDYDIVIVDYINIMESDRATSVDNSYSKIKQISEDLRGIAVVFDVPVVTATQLNRTGYNNGAPGLENTAESMGIVVTADVMIGIWQDKEEKIKGKLNGVLMKNRYGPNDIYFEMGIDYKTLRIIPEWEKYIEPDASHKEKKNELEKGKPHSENVMNYLGD